MQDDAEEDSQPAGASHENGGDDDGGETRAPAAKRRASSGFLVGQCHTSPIPCSAPATVQLDLALEFTFCCCHRLTCVLFMVAGSRPGSRSRQGTPVAEAGTAQKSGRSSGGRAGSKGPSRERSAERKPLKVTLKTGGAQNGVPGMRAKSVTGSGQKQLRKVQD